jgi:hypothetical protein
MIDGRLVMLRSTSVSPANSRTLIFGADGVSKVLMLVTQSEESCTSLGSTAVGGAGGFDNGGRRCFMALRIGSISFSGSIHGDEEQLRRRQVRTH